jgi:hypothetical protein
VQMHTGDENFEVYLKQFRPRAPEALPAVSGTRKTRRALALGAWAAAILLTAALVAANWSVKPTIRNRSLHPLTIGAANELLESAPSVKAAMDELVRDSQEKAVPKSQSAFEALSEETVNP